MSEKYYEALGRYTHHLQVALKLGNEFRSAATELEHICKNITSAFYPYSENALPPKTDSYKILELSEKLAKLNDEIEKNIKEANLYAKEANKRELERKDF